MFKIIYKHGNLLNNVNGIILHACNAQKVWGAGIALHLKNKYPKAYEEFKNRHNLCSGQGFIVKHNNQEIACLITSTYYGKYCDDPDTILVNTQTSLRQLLDTIPENDIVINSPKINSGLFNVPWHLTEHIIKNECGFSIKNITWIVWEL